MQFVDTEIVIGEDGNMFRLRALGDPVDFVLFLSTLFSAAGEVEIFGTSVGGVIGTGGVFYENYSSICQTLPAILSQLRSEEPP